MGGGFDYLTQAETENLAQTQALHVSHTDLISTFNVEKTSVDLLAALLNIAGSSPKRSIPVLHLSQIQPRNNPVM